MSRLSVIFSFFYYLLLSLSALSASIESVCSITFCFCWVFLLYSLCWVCLFSSRLFRLYVLSNSVKTVCSALFCRVLQFCYIIIINSNSFVILYYVEPVCSVLSSLSVTFCFVEFACSFVHSIHLIFINSILVQFVFGSVPSILIFHHHLQQPLMEYIP